MSSVQANVTACKTIAELLREEKPGGTYRMTKAAGELLCSSSRTDIMSCHLINRLRTRNTRDSFRRDARHCALALRRRLEALHILRLIACRLCYDVAVVYVHSRIHARRCYCIHLDICMSDQSLSSAESASSQEGQQGEAQSESV